MYASLSIGDRISWNSFKGKIVGRSNRLGVSTYEIQLKNGKKKTVTGHNLYPYITDHIIDPNSPDRA